MRICGQAAESAEARVLRHKAALLEVERAALEVLAGELGIPSASRDAWRAYLAVQPADRRERALRLFRETRLVEVDRRVAPLEPAVRDELERLRALTIARLGHDPAAIERVERATLRWASAPEAIGGELPRALRVGCGDHLMIDDAWVTKDARELTLCPGFLLVSLDPADPAPGGPLFRERIAFLLAHELAHVAIGPPHGTPTREAEIRADALAAEIIAIDLDERDVGERGAFLRRTLEPICAPEGDPTHPPGRVRVEEVVARQPTLAAALGCEDVGGSGRPSGR